MTGDPFNPERGGLTFDAEGQEQGRYHSRKLHVPSAASGLTLGRGYDMKLRAAARIREELARAGLDPADGERLSNASGLRGPEAEAFIRDNDLADFEITPEQQRALFDIVFASEEAEARRLATKADVVAAYGRTDWDTLDPAIRDVLVDLKFRGDYTGATRKFLQSCVVANDLEAFSAEIGNPKNWPRVPKDRFERRRKFCESAVAKGSEEGEGGAVA